MIEGEEVLESAQETGYRLCVAPIDNDSEEKDWSKIFSAQWDPNSENRMYVCSQKGQLRAYDISTGAYRSYRILFRKHSSDLADLLEDGRAIHYHWDKMLAIPERPDELVFLLGVSKNLMYSALPGTVPYPSEPFISGTTRSDFTGYIYGTPVMELWSHIARITSVAVSPTGQLLASGDEQGNVKLLMLRLLDQLIITQKGAKDSKKGGASQLPTFSTFRPEYKITTRAHLHGPIFAMQWLQMPSLPPKGSDEDLFNSSRRTRYYCLATGSMDCAVRLWGVTCSTSKGLTMSPIMVLDTLSTQTLALHSYLCITKPTPSEELQRKQQLRLRTSATKLKNSGAAVEIPDPSAIYLSAGTTTGSIYLWKLDTVHIFNTIASLDVSLAPGEGLTKFTPVRLIDDGSWLHSLLQSSDRPIVSVAISAARDPKASSSSFSGGRRLCLVAVDSSSVIRSHRESDFAVDVEDNEGGPDSGHNTSATSKKGRSGASVTSSVSRMSGGNAEKPRVPTQYPMVLCGEAFYPSTTVIAASYHEISPAPSASISAINMASAAELAQAMARGDRWSYEGKFGGRSRMLVGTSDGQLQIVETNQAFYPDPVVDSGENIQSLLARLKNVNQRISPAQPEREMSGFRVENLSLMAPRVGDNAITPAPVSHSSTSMRVAWSAANVADSDMYTGDKVGVYKDYDAVGVGSVFGEGGAMAPVAMHGAVLSHQLEAERSASAGAGTGSFAHQFAPAAGGSSDSSSSSGTGSRAGSQHYSASSSGGEVDKENMDQRDQRDASLVPSTLTAPVAVAPSSSQSADPGQAGVRSAAPPPPPMPPAPPASTTTAREDGRGRPAKSAAQAVTSAPARDKARAASTADAASRDASPSPRPILKTQNAQPPTGHAAQKSRAKSAIAVSLAPETRSPEPIPLEMPTCAMGHNSYATATVNSSAVLYQQLQALQAKVDSDDISVTTVNTTMSARLAAASVVNMPADMPRYREMTPVLDANDIMAHLASGKIKILHSLNRPPSPPARPPTHSKKPTSLNFPLPLPGVAPTLQAWPARGSPPKSRSTPHGCTARRTWAPPPTTLSRSPPLTQSLR